MKLHGEAFVGIDAAKARNAVAIAEGGRDGEVRYLGEFDATPEAMARLVRKLGDRYEALHFAMRQVRRDMGCIGRFCPSGTNALWSPPL